ncbi:MAG TPA: geranylgeranyl reductase, partial [Betaproteobacteria bacterium]|nr:geranylgeranyl reductase [Betaproteobacteria bacterium]
MDNVDVLVAGIGPAGACAAWAAASAGLKVIAVERKRRVGEPVQCAELIPRALVRWAQGAVVQPLPAMETMLPSGRAYTAAMESLMIDRAVFDQRLAARAEAAGAALSLQTRLTGLAAGDSLAAVEYGGRRR